MTSQNTVLVTGGAGFIGSNFVLDWIAATGESVVNLDALTYAGNRENLASLDGDARHLFVQGDIRDRPLLDALFARHRPRAVIHFAAESHVDRSIHGPAAFVKTNVLGTFTLLEAARQHWTGLAETERSAFRFLHVSTDEVYGSLRPDAPAFTESHPLRAEQPVLGQQGGERPPGARLAPHLRPAGRSPPTARNNYGPYHFPEKLIPLMIVNALAGKPLPVYGDGMQVRDWLYVKDHCARHPRGAGARPARRDLQRRRLEREAQHRDRRRPSARCSTNCGPIRRARYRRADHAT